MKELITVIVPVYNIKKYLQRCVDSILAQSYQTFELILIDDGSTDGSSQICDEYVAVDPRVKVIHKKNAGVSAARNDGIGLASGTYLAFIDGDDWIEADYLKKLVQAIAENKADEAAASFKYVYETGKEKSLYICDSTETMSNIEALNQAMDPIRPWVGFAWGKVFKSSVIKNNYIKYDTGISLCEDSLFNYNVLQYATKVVKIPDVLYNYYIRNDSATRNASANFKSLRSKVDAFEKAAMIAKIWGGNFQIRINHALFSAIISYCAAMFSAKNYNKSTIYDMKIKLKFIRPLVVFKELPKGIKFRYVLLKLNPRLLYLIEAKRK